MSIPPKKNVLNEKSPSPIIEPHLHCPHKKELKHKRPTINSMMMTETLCVETLSPLGSVMRL